VYVPALLTVIDGVVSVVLHNNVPDAVVDKVEVPLQLFTTLTEGVAGVVFGAATPEPAELVQPFTVCVTVYVPALITVIDVAVPPVLHNNVPDAVVDKVDVPSQLFTTFTDGVAGRTLQGNPAVISFNVTALNELDCTKLPEGLLLLLKSELQTVPL
jgi:hypothetical protein